MSTLGAKIFTVESNQNSDDAPRAARRLIFNADILKAFKLCTGDTVTLSSTEHQNGNKVWTYDHVAPRLVTRPSVLMALTL